ncbi:MAG: hypothetical protein CEE40_09885 [Chloroflexi bacterium B3_Chlor]|nr:MAG: hypothetical protein CEE40_09885 [Chloroflexi bacterium B3_Chlor]
MKNQYFGDINDYRKYGLLRLFSGYGEITTAACWMLTPDDGRTDGSFTDYLHQPEKWRRYDRELYDHLRDLVLVQNLRDVRGVETVAILSSCRFAPGLLPNDAEGRAAYFDTFAGVTEGCDLIFFDPDNGIQVKSKPYGRKDSSKYLYWHEIRDSFSAGHSLLIYQHFPRVKREPFIDTLARELAENTGAQEVYSFRTPRVLFLLAPQDRHREFFRECSEKVEAAWGSQIAVARHRYSDPQRH